MDLPPILLTLGARVGTISPEGRRWISISDLFVGYYQTALSSRELITEVEVPEQPSGVHAWYEKFTARSIDDWPAVGAAVWFTVESNTISEARIAVSAATEHVVRLKHAEAILKNATPAAHIFSKAADAAAEEVQPITDLRGTASYKREMVRVHVRRALEKAQLWQQR
jgi:carbon-monoxide dehydrogenase medium subunit